VVVDAPPPTRQKPQQGRCSTGFARVPNSSKGRSWPAHLRIRPERLLFLDAEQIQAIGNQLRQARSLLVDLARDPSLRGMAELLDNAEFGVAESAAPPELAGLLTQFAGTVEQRAQGRPAEMNWNAVFSVGPDARGTRRVVQIDPVLDNSSIDRAGPALSTLDQAMAEVRSLIRRSRCMSPGNRCCASRS
jgi:hypothetical protein